MALFGLIGGHSNRQDVCLLAETNSISDERLECSTTHAESLETAEAWGLDANQQCKDEKTGRYIQFVSALSCDPIKIYRGFGAALTNVTNVASQTEDQEMVYVDEGRNKDGRLLWIGVCLSMLTLTVCILVLNVVV